MNESQFYHKITRKERVAYVVCTSIYQRRELYKFLCTTSDDNTVVLIVDNFHPKDAEIKLNLYQGKQFMIFTNDPLLILQAPDDATFYKQDDNGDITQPIRSVKDWTPNILLTSPLFDVNRVSFGDNTDTSDDFLYTKIHKAIAKKCAGLPEENIEKIVDEELTKSC